MSGGGIGYFQYKIEETIETIQETIDTNGKPDKDRWDYPIYSQYEEDTIDKLKDAIKILELAKVYTTRIDYLIAGDDGEESFHKRLKEELEALPDLLLQP